MSKSYFQTIFSLDLRSLGIYRIGIGLILFIDFIVRAFDSKTHYSNLGVLPHAVTLFDTETYRFSFHFLSKGWEGQLVLILMGCLFALMLTIGYKTRFATVLSWLFFLSLYNRNPLVSSGADMLLLLLLFWSIFLPLGARYSLDSLHYSLKKLPIRVFSLGTIAFTLQMNFLYLFAAIWKIDPIWIRDGTAVYYVLHNYAYTTYFGHFLDTYFSWSLRILTFSVYILEAIGFFFLYSPFKTGLLRTIAIFAFMMMHVGIGLSMHLGSFSFVAIAALIALLPSYFWEKLNIIGRFPTIAVNIQKTPIKTPPMLHLSKVSSLFIGMCLLYVLYINILTVLPVKRFLYIPHEEKIGSVLGLTQNWNMFAPHPPLNNRWHVVIGTLQNGTEINLLSPQDPITFQPPKLTFYKNAHRAKYMFNLLTLGYRNYALFLCRDWNSTHTGRESLKNIKIYALRQKISLEGKKENIHTPLVYQWTCEVSSKYIIQ